MKLYITKTSGNAWKVRLLLSMLKLPFETVVLDTEKKEHKTPEFLKLNPRGQVPVLVDGGEAITQIVAILLHLDAKLPQAGILPAAGMARTRALSTLMWMNNTVHPTFTHVFMPYKFTDDEAAQKAIRDFARKTYRDLLGEIEAMAAKASPWLCGNQPTALDAYALTLLRWGGYAEIDPTTLPALWDLAQRFAALPAVARVVERERLQLNVYQPVGA